MENKIDEYKKYLDMGYRFLPIDPGTKKAACRWKMGDGKYGFDQIEFIEQWLAQGLDIGISCGGILVIDCDLYKDQNGLQHLVDKLFTTTAPIQKTQSGGFHFFFKSPNLPIKNWNGKFSQNVDLKTTGGYVRTGGNYKWEMPLFEISELPDVPDFVMERLQELCEELGTGQANVERTPEPSTNGVYYRVADVPESDAAKIRGHADPNKERELLEKRIKPCVRSFLNKRRDARVKLEGRPDDKTFELWGKIGSGTGMGASGLLQVTRIGIHEFYLAPDLYADFFDWVERECSAKRISQAERNHKIAEVRKTRYQMPVGSARNKPAPKEEHEIDSWILDNERASQGFDVPNLDDMPQNKPDNIRQRIEMTLLAAVMPHLAELDNITLTPDDFHVETHAIIWRALCDLRTTGIQSTEPILIISYLENDVNFQLKDDQQKSAVFSLVERLAKVPFKLEHVQQYVFHICGDGADGRPKSIAEIAVEYMENYDSKIESIMTGISQLDELTCGFFESQMIVLAARPGMGKTAMALWLMLNMARAGHGVLFVSLEMSQRELLERLASSIDSIPFKMIRNKTVDKGQVANAFKKISELPIHIFDRSGLSVSEIESQARTMIHKHDVKCIMIDHLGLLKNDQSKKSRYEQVTEISHSLKNMAKKLKIPVVALTQLNREPANAKDKRPTLAHLRDSGAIEEDADLVLTLHRNGYYDKNAKNPNEVELDIAKNRSGPVGVVPLEFEPDFVRFAELPAFGFPAGLVQRNTNTATNNNRQVEKEHPQKRRLSFDD